VVIKRLSLLLVSLAPYAASYSQTVSTKSLIEAALERTQQSVRYDGSYQKISYPLGDVPTEIGVCTDVLIRSYRKIGVDLQEQVHKDMSVTFSAYPNIWGLQQPDTNIDHRRVPNLETFFRRHGETLTISDRAEDYRPGDIVSWRLSNNLPHIGLVSDQQVPGTQRYMIIHNIGAGPVIEDALFAYRITGHFRYLPNAAFNRGS